MKRFDIVADVVFYLDEKKLSGKLIAGIDCSDLISALKWFDAQIVEKAELFDANDYFVVPLYIGKDQNAVSKKYYFEVVRKDEDLRNNWCN